MIDLRSDTVTRPSKGMLEAMVRAEVGDDVLGDDPTVMALESQASALAGKEAALFTPSGTMANQLAIRGWTEPGDEVLMEVGAHPFNYEAAGAAVISGVQVRTLTGERGCLSAETVEGAIRPFDDHFAPARLVFVENTTNRGGGAVYAQPVLDKIARVSRQRGLYTHVDGARAFNACVATGTPLSRMCRDYDSIMFCLSKGLGAPVGSLLCGPTGFIRKARRMRKMMGGGMRQAGYLAACGLYALEYNIERLAEDHRRTRALHEGLCAAGYACTEPETNMLYVTVQDAPRRQEELARRGVACLSVSPTSLRLVVHLDIDDDDIERTLNTFGQASPARP